MNWSQNCPQWHMWLKLTVIYSDHLFQTFWLASASSEFSCLQGHIQEKNKLLIPCFRGTNCTTVLAGLTRKDTIPFLHFCICAENDSYFGFIGSALTRNKSWCNLHAKHLLPSQKLQVINDSANFANFAEVFQSF